MGSDGSDGTDGSDGNGGTDGSDGRDGNDGNDGNDGRGVSLTRDATRWLPGAVRSVLLLSVLLLSYEAIRAA